MCFFSFPLLLRPVSPTRVHRKKYMCTHAGDSSGDDKINTRWCGVYCVFLGGILAVYIFSVLRWAGRLTAIIRPANEHDGGRRDSSARVRPSGVSAETRRVYGLRKNGDGDPCELFPRGIRSRGVVGLGRDTRAFVVRCIHTVLCVRKRVSGRGRMRRYNVFTES